MVKTLVPNLFWLMIPFLHHKFQVTPEPFFDRGRQSRSTSSDIFTLYMFNFKLIYSHDIERPHLNSSRPTWGRDPKFENKWNNTYKGDDSYFSVLNTLRDVVLLCLNTSCYQIWFHRHWHSSHTVNLVLFVCTVSKGPVWSMQILNWR